MKKTKLEKQGFTLIEALMGMTIVSIVLIGVISSQMGNYKAIEKNKDAIFAQNKAVQMIEELRSVVKSGERSFNSLDTYDNKNIPTPVLTTDDIEGVTVDAKAANQISGNRIHNGKWRFVRVVKVRKSQDSPKSRTVAVSIYYADAKGKAIDPPLATLSTVLSSSYGSNLPTQVMDTYAIAIHNQPGWWSALTSLKQRMEDAVYDLRVKNPGLDYRFHFITKSSFGRDPYYTPYCNKVRPTVSDTNIKYPYIYNGKVLDTHNDNIQTYFYDPIEMVGDGMRLHTDDSNANGEALYNTWYGTEKSASNTPVGSNSDTDKASATVYSAADQYNHAVRGPEDEAINEKFKNYYSNLKPAVDYEPTYRKLLDEMLDSDGVLPLHRNLMITNLHGELFPTIPLRNYSDAAKTPSGQEQVHKIDGTGIVKVSSDYSSSMYKRVVTHPEQLEYSTNNTNDRKIYLRVYPYLSDPTQSTSDVNEIDTISLFIPTTKNVGAKITETDSQILDYLPDFTIPNTTTVIDQIKNNIKFQYIDSDFVKRSNNYTGYVKIGNPKKAGVATNFYPTGSIINIGGYNFKIVAKRSATSDVYVKATALITKNTNSDTANIYKIVSCELNKEVALDNVPFLALTNVSVINIDPLNTAGAWTVDVAPVISTAYTTLGLTESAANIHSIYEGTYEIIVNPAFDRMGIGKKTINPGILIKLHGTETKNTGKYTGSTYIDVGGIPTDSRLYGLDYIPSPFGKDMFRSGTTTKSYPIKDIKGSTYYTNTFTDTNLGGSNTSDLLFGSGYGAYTGLKGRDLDSAGSYAKNTARWIISINVGNTNTLESNNILRNFQDKMMTVETRIGENLNTGMSLNQSPNPYDGTVEQKALLSTNTNKYVIINETSGYQLNDGTYPCNSSVSDCGTDSNFPSVLSNSTTNPTVSDSNKNDLSNLSRTYVWIGNTVIKETEKYQMVGDIRHNPYVDTLENNRVNLHFNTFADTGSASSLNATNYPNLGTLSSSSTFAQSKNNIDVSRFFDLFKKSLIYTNSIYNSLVGFPFYYYALGGEVGSNGISVNFVASGIPYNSSSNKTIGETSSDYYNEILEDTTVSPGSRIIGSNNQSWGSVPWIGELYPDSFFGSTSDSTSLVKWANTGNLPSATTGLPNTSADKFSRQQYTTKFKNITASWPSSTSSYVAYSASKPRNRLAETGVQVFFHGSANAATTKSYSQYFTSAVGKITTTGRELVSNYGLIMSDTVDVPRAFNFIGTPPSTPLWTMYDSQFNKLFFLGDTGYVSSTSAGSSSVFYDAGTSQNDKAGSAPVVIDATSWKTTGDRSKGYVLINGLASQGVESGTIIGRYALMSMLHTYFRTGNKNSYTDIDTLNNRTMMVERTVIQDSSNATSPAILTPKDGVEVIPSESYSEIPIAWKTTWKKWDGGNYSLDYSDAWKEKSLEIKYNILVSTNNRGTWKYLKSDGTLSTENATPGVYNITSELYVLKTIPSDFSGNSEAVSDVKLKIGGLDGDIVFRIEGHRFDTCTSKLIPTNYSFHERTLSINRL